MVRCGSIYDNYNCDTSTLFDPLPEEDEADEENSVVLHIDDDDTIENDIQGTGFRLFLARFLLTGQIWPL